VPKADVPGVCKCFVMVCAKKSLQGDWGMLVESIRGGSGHVTAMGGRALPWAL
jgi:hypothetical protein